MERVKKRYTREDIFSATRACTDRFAILDISSNKLCLCVDGEYETIKEAKEDARSMQKKARESYNKRSKYVVVDRQNERIYRVK